MDKASQCVHYSEVSLQCNTLLLLTLTCEVDQYERDPEGGVRVAKSFQLEHKVLRV